MSYRGVMMKLGVIPAGGNYIKIPWRVKELGLDISHFTGMGWNKGERFRVITPELPLSALLRNGVSVQSYKLKQRLFRDGILMPQCQQCGWARRSPDGRVPVELDHINGDKYHNRLDNLRILCPNCHSMTSTYRGRNIKSRAIGALQHAKNNGLQ
jgi:RNase P subunit RPR2